MMKVVASATCFFGKFEEPTLRVFVPQSPIFARHDTICSVFIAILVHTYHILPGHDVVL